MPDILELIRTETDIDKLVKALKGDKVIDNEEINQLDPLKHDVYDTVKRKDKLVKVDAEDPEFSGVLDESGNSTQTRVEPVNRVAFAIQKLIVKRGIAFVFGREVELNAEPEGASEETVLKALKRIAYDTKEKSFNRKVARSLFSTKEVAEIWYSVDAPNKVYGFPSAKKLRCTLFSALQGDELFPYKDKTGDMLAFSRGFTVMEGDKEIKHFETYTSEAHYMWAEREGGFALVDGFPEPNELGKIPVIYGSQEQVEWADVQNLIDRLEKLLSNFADTNDYHAAPKIFVTGGIKGWAKKGESGAIIEGEDGSDAKYLSWQNAPESVKLEIDTLLRMIWTITQTPDISFDAMKGIGQIATQTLKLLFLDAHLKVADHQEVLDDYLQRRINIKKAFIGKLNVSLAQAAEDLFVEPEIIPYMITDEAAEIKIWSDACGGNVLSQKEAFNKANLTNDPNKDYDQYLSEQKGKSTDVLSMTE